MSLTVTVAVDTLVLLGGAYWTTIVHVPPAVIVKPDTQVPPVTVNAPVPAVLVAVGVAVSFKGPGFVEVALLVRVMVPL